MKKRSLSIKKRKEVIQALKQWGFPRNIVSKKDIYEEVPLSKGSVIMINQEPFLIEHEEHGLIPHLKLIQRNKTILPLVMVDKGSLKFLLNGADVMRPGVKEVLSEFDKNELICVIEETSRNPILVGKTLFDSQQFQELKKGKVILNYHYLGDQFWKAVI